MSFPLFISLAAFLSVAYLELHFSIQNNLPFLAYAEVAIPAQFSHLLLYPVLLVNFKMSFKRSQSSSITTRKSFLNSQTVRLSTLSSVVFTSFLIDLSHRTVNLVGTSSQFFAKQLHLAKHWLRSRYIDRMNE